MIHLTFACGHRRKLDPDKDTPECLECGEKRIAHVGAPPPRFSGAVSGPYAQTTVVTPVVVDLTSGETLKLKKNDKENDDAS